MRAAVLAYALLAAGCTYDFDQLEPNGSSTAPDGGSVVADAAAADGGGGPAVDSGSAPADTGRVDTGPVDTGCAPPDPTSACYATVKTCADACSSARKSCEAACPNPGCKKNCTTEEGVCRNQCVTDCVGCTTAAGCGAFSQCRAALP